MRRAIGGDGLSHRQTNVIHAPDFRDYTVRREIGRVRPAGTTGHLERETQTFVSRNLRPGKPGFAGVRVEQVDQGEGET